MEGDSLNGHDHDSTWLLLPPRVYDRAPLLTDHIMVPHPGFRVDRLTHRTEQPERLAARPLYVLLPCSHQRADCCRRGIHNADLMPVDHLPDTRRIGIGRRALEEDLRGTVE